MPPPAGVPPKVAIRQCMADRAHLNQRSSSSVGFCPAAIARPMLRQGVRNKKEYAVGVHSNEQDGPSGIGFKSPHAGLPDRPSGEHAEGGYYGRDTDQRRRNPDAECRDRIMQRVVEDAQATEGNDGRQGLVAEAATFRGCPRRFPQRFRAGGQSTWRRSRLCHAAMLRAKVLISNPELTRHAHRKPFYRQVLRR
jgi:hypothetical protein